MSNEKNAAEILKTLGHPIRLKILYFLLNGPSCATLANRNINISQPNMSQHLKALTKIGILDFCKVGTKKCFYITCPSFVKELLQTLDKDHRRVILTEEDLRSEHAAESEK